MGREGIPQFSPQEFRRRYESVRTMMDEKGYDALLVCGHNGNREHYQANACCLAHVAPRHDCYLIFPKAGDPVLFITHCNRLASAKEVAVIEDVRRAARVPNASEAFRLRAPPLRGR